MYPIKTIEKRYTGLLQGNASTVRTCMAQTRFVLVATIYILIDPNQIKVHL